MESLSAADRALACRVLHERYKACVKETLKRDVLAELDLDAPTRKCAPLFAELTTFCTDHLQSGALAAPKSGGAQQAGAVRR
jgi:hypothetical protein